MAAVGAAVWTTGSCKVGCCFCLPTSRLSLSPNSVWEVKSCLVVGRSRSAGETTGLTAVAVFRVDNLGEAGCEKARATIETALTKRIMLADTRSVKIPTLELVFFFITDGCFCLEADVENSWVN